MKETKENLFNWKTFFPYSGHFKTVQSCYEVVQNMKKKHILKKDETIIWNH